MSWLQALFSRNDRHPSIDVDDIDRADASEMMIEEPYDPDFTLSGMRVGVVYKDRQGLRTKRIIRLKRLDANEFESYLHAFCELRKEDRTFVVQSILTLYDPSTGEILEDASTFFQPYIDARLEAEELEFEKSRYRSAWQIIEALRDELQVLILIARADNRFVRAEQAALLRYASERASDLNIEVDDKSLVVLRDWMKVQDPAEPEVRLALRNLKNTPNALEAIWEVSELIAQADGKIREEERSSIAEIRQTIESLSASG